MSSLRSKGFVLLALLFASAGALGIGLAARSAPVSPASPAPPSQETVSRMKLQEALRDASILDLIRNGRVAARKGDEVTRSAMVSGLMKEPTRARALISHEISKASDSADISILNRMISELP